jgi:hypothetical protein
VIDPLAFDIVDAIATCVDRVTHQATRPGAAGRGDHMSYDTPPPPPPGGSPYGAPQPARASSAKAVWSLVCGIVGLVCFGIILGPVAIVLGRQAQRQGSPGGMARAGEILGYVDIALFVVSIIIFANR